MDDTRPEFETRCVCLSPGLGIALAGGGGRGLAQIGVLKVFDREGIPVEYVAGTSVGAIIGGLYALTGRADVVEAQILELLDRTDGAGRLFGRFHAIARHGTGNRHSIVDGLRRYWALGRGLTGCALAPPAEIRDPLEEIFGGRSFADTHLPFAVTAVDLNSGRRLILAAGPLAEAVYASAALPGAVPPLEIDGYRLIDGGFGEPVPVQTCRYLGAGHVVGVDVLGRPPTSRRERTGLAILMRADQVARYALEQEHLAKADVLVTPEVEALDWTDFSDPEARIAEGERAAMEKLGEIREMLERFEKIFVGGSIVAPSCEPRSRIVPTGAGR